MMLSTTEAKPSLDFVKRLENAFTRADRETFERLLYQRIREVAFAVCQPKLPSTDPSSMNVSFDVGLPEYSILLNSIFADFEAFLANEKGKKPAVKKTVSDGVYKRQRAGGGAQLASLNARLTASCPKVPSFCGQIVTSPESAFTCSDCSTGLAGYLCKTCFLASIHTEHKYQKEQISCGFCACGHEEAWTGGVCCRIHGDDELQKEKNRPKSGSSGDGTKVLLTVEEEQRQEMELLKQRLEALPLDVVKRCTYLLRPLIESASLALFGLIQGSPRPTSVIPLSRLPKQPSNSGVETPEKEDPDCPEIVDCWPPPLSHLPSSFPSKDAAQLAAFTTASSNKRISEVEARCRAQQSRANRLHPLLYAPRSREEARFSAILYSNRFHWAPDVFRTLPVNYSERLVACSTALIMRDGRTPLLTLVPFRDASKLCNQVMSSCPTSSARPLRVDIVDCNIYALEQFFRYFLRWLQRLVSEVQHLRPLICNALLGRYVAFSTTATAEGGVSAFESAFLLPGEMLAEQSLLAQYFAQVHATYSGLRRSLAAVITAFLMQETFYQSVFAIEFIRHFERIAHITVYDENTGTVPNEGLTTHSQALFEQTISHPKLARQLLLQNNAPLRMISRFCRTIAANAIPLPGFYATGNSRKCLADLFSPDCTFQFFPPALQNRLLALRTANREAWRRAHEYTRIAAASTDVYSPAEQPLYSPKVLVWLYEPQFKMEQVPFARNFLSVIATSAFLKGLLHTKPLAGESKSCPEGWWDEVSRANFLAYFRCLLEILSYMQDTNSMQRNLERNADAKQKLLTLRLLSDNSCPLSLLISLSAHLASTDRTLLLAAIKETREAFEQRVGVIDRCFRVAPATHTQESSLLGQWDDKEIASTSFQALGATSEVYEYDVAKMRVSIVQPLPRLLAVLYGYGIEMGLSPALLGLADEGFVNLVIERPLQMVTFLAQCSANLWLPNSDECQKLIVEISTTFSMENFGRDYQLLQQAAAVSPPDELIVRMVHKLNLKDYLSETSSQPSPGCVQAAESLLWVLHFIVTNRSSHGVGYFDPSVVAAMPSLPHLFPPDFNDLDESLEIEHGLLVDDVIHQLCLHPMTSSEVLSAIPPQPRRSCLHQVPPYYGLSAPTVHNSIGTENVVANRHAISDNEDLKGPICRILQEVATKTLVGAEQKYSLRPEVLVRRFNRFYPSYRLEFATQAKETVFTTLTQARKVNSNLFPVGFPIPPPPPCPRRRFVDHLNAPILRLLRCPTFVRLLRQLLDIGIKYGSQQSRWSGTLLELVLHLIIIALYEDFVTFAETGERPFLKAVRLVPEVSESAEELEHLAEVRHWERQDSTASTNNSCLVGRLQTLLEMPCHSCQFNLIRWTLKLWKSISESQSPLSILPTSETNVTEGASEADEEVRLREDRDSNLKTKLASMQRKLINKNLQLEFLLHDDKNNDTPDIKPDVVMVMQWRDVNGKARTVEAVTVDLCRDSKNLRTLAVLGPASVEARFRALKKKKAASLYCVICQEDVMEGSEHGLVVGALAARSSVVSMPPPCARAVFSESENTTSPNYYTSADNACVDRNLAAIATSTVAALVGNERMLDDIYLFGKLTRMRKAFESAPAPCAAGRDRAMKIPQWELREPTTFGADNNTLAAVSWFPRPLVASRDPIGEEGTFIAFCGHMMHADCKEKLPPCSKFVCPVCHALSNLDLPLFGRVTDVLSPVWLSRQLGVDQSSYDLTSWLKRLQSWLDERQRLAPACTATNRHLSLLPNESELDGKPAIASVLCPSFCTSGYQVVRHTFRSPPADANNLPGSLNELYRLIDLAKFNVSKQRRGRRLVRRSQLRAFLAEVLQTCKTVFAGQETRDTPKSANRNAPKLCTSLPVEPPPNSTYLWVLVHQLTVLSYPSVGDPFCRPAFLKMTPFLSSHPVITGDPKTLSQTLGELYRGLLECLSSLLDFADVFGLGMHDFRSKCTVDKDTIERPAPVDRFSQSVNNFRFGVARTRQLGMLAVWLAACEWRAVRHTVAYTLVVWERNLRRQGPAVNFFNGGLSERHRTSLGYLLRAAFQAHARLAPVPRGCFPTCLKSDGDAGQHARAECWPQRRDDPEWWWWHSYFSPAVSGATHMGCCRDSAAKPDDLLEPVSRLAVSEDAVRLWSLLLPGPPAESASSTSETTEGIVSTTEGADYSLSAGPSSLTSSMKGGVCRRTNPYQSVSVLWEADITFLFVNLLFLRPGLEDESAAVECQRLQSLRTMRTSEVKSDATVVGHGRGQETPLPSLAACDEGFPRLPIGDSHETFLLRLCYLALLVQALLSWQSNEQQKLDATIEDSGEQQEEFLYSGMDPHVSPWLTSKLLTVRHRLRLLCGLPDCDKIPSSATATLTTLRDLFAHLRTTCLPFLRIAAFIMQEITAIDVPDAAMLCQPSADKSIDEFIFLLAYLGLPLGPEDLLTVLSVGCIQPDDKEKLYSMKCQSGDSSSSLCLARIIIAWCHAGRSSASRDLYANLRQHSLPQLRNHPVLLPEPQIRVPHLIRLPREYVRLSVLANEWLREHAGSASTAAPALCLVCGALASFPLPQLLRLNQSDMEAHVCRHHAGYAFVLALQVGTLYLFFEQVELIIRLPEIYRDENGEPDPGMRRGVPLFLDEAAYRHLNETWLMHEAFQPI